MTRTWTTWTTTSTYSDSDIEYGSIYYKIILTADSILCQPSHISQPAKISGILLYIPQQNVIVPHKNYNTQRTVHALCKCLYFHLFNAAKGYGK